jgi:outer membrane protein OmpA-like peptidoglycan-associated protein
MAEDARIITFRKMQEEQLANERAAAAQREAQAQEQARRSAEQARLDQERREAAEADRHAAEQARAQAEQAKIEAQQAAAQAARDKSAADAAREAAISQQQLAKADADRLRQVAEQAESEKSQLRERLRQQLNMILETRESARGLIVNINDVLFDFNKYTLKPGAREKLAKVAGILLAYPGLKVQLEGHTDSIGSDEYNLKLSDARAGAVRDYLVSQNVPATNLTAAGFGKDSPVASNDTAAGRQQNRRVEMVVSGDPIGVGGQQ